MYNPAVIANYFLNKASSEGRALTPMQIIKMVYIAHGWHLGYGLGPLINEGVQAWKYGPVLESLYHEVKGFGRGAISGRIGEEHHSSTSSISDGSRRLLDAVWESYKDFNGIQLSTMTHREGTPWDIVWNQSDGRMERGAIISDALIADHYAEKVSKDR